MLASHAEAQQCRKVYAPVPVSALPRRVQADHPQTQHAKQTVAKGTARHRLTAGSNMSAPTRRFLCSRFSSRLQASQKPEKRSRLRNEEEAEIDRERSSQRNLSVCYRRMRVEVQHSRRQRPPPGAEKGRPLARSAGSHRECMAQNRVVAPSAGQEAAELLPPREQREWPPCRTLPRTQNERSQRSTVFCRYSRRLLLFRRSA